MRNRLPVAWSSRRRLASALFVAALASPWALFANPALPAPAPAPASTSVPAPTPAASTGVLVHPSGETPLRYLERGPSIFLCLSDLAPVLKGALSADEPGAIFTFKAGERTFHFTIEAAVATIDDNVVDLSAAPIVSEGGPYLPFDFIAKRLFEPAGFSAEWARADHALRVRATAGSETPVTVSVAHSGESSKCVFTFEGNVQFQAEKKIDGAVLQITTPKLSPFVPDLEFNDPIVKGVSFRGHSASVQYRRGSWATEVYSLSNPFRIVVEVQPVMKEIGGIRLGRTPTPAPAELKSGVQTIVLDPGHGGSENGAPGRAGNLEKDLTLELCRALKGVLESKGYKVFLTRDRDVQVALEDRPALANHLKADLFLSIHLNASPAKKPHGSETYYLALSATDEAARRLAESENAAGTSGKEDHSTTNEDLDFLLWDLVQNEHVKESAVLAESIQNEMNGLLGLSNRGIKQAPFRVLVGAAMPAVLVEVGFITNPEEERNLVSAEFRKRVADAISLGIEAYRSHAEPRMSPAAASSVSTPPAPRSAP